MIPTCYTVNISSDIASTLTDFFFIDLAFLHCNTDGSLNYNNDAFSPGSDPDMLAGVQLLNNDSCFVLFSIGGTGGDDFVNISNNYCTFLGNLLAVLEYYGVSGVDFDFENAPTPQIQTACQQLVQDLTNAGYIVTAVPTGSLQFWQQIVQNTNDPDGNPLVFMYNLQLYGGVDYGQWVTAFTGIVPEPQIFLGSGYLSGQNTPQQVSSALSTLLSDFPDSLEAFIWRSPLVSGDGTTMADYANAIINAGAAAPRAAAVARVTEHRERTKKREKKTPQSKS